MYNGYRVFPGGKERPERDPDPSPRSSAVGHERVELYLYSLYGPYGLYRASGPVQGCTLPLPFMYILYKGVKFIYYCHVHTKTRKLDFPENSAFYFFT